MVLAVATLMVLARSAERHHEPAYSRSSSHSREVPPNHFPRKQEDRRPHLQETVHRPAATGSRADTGCRLELRREPCSFSTGERARTPGTTRLGMLVRSTRRPRPASKEGERDSGQGPEEQGIHLKPTAAWPYGSRISGSPIALSYKTIISLRSSPPPPPSRTI